MSKMREKTTATLLIAVFTISIFAVVIPASAKEGWGKPYIRVRAIGHFTSVDTTSEGHECFVNIQARRVADGWTGRGVFKDKDYIGGKLVAIITVNDVAREDKIPHHIILLGIVEVSIADEYSGTYFFDSPIRPTLDNPYGCVIFNIPQLRYLAKCRGTDIPVKITIDVL